MIFKCEIGDFDTGTNFNGSGTIMIKPEDVDILEKDQGSGIRGIVKSRRYMGDKVYYTVKTEGMTLKVASSVEMGLKLGSTVILGINFSKGIFYQ